MKDSIITKAVRRIRKIRFSKEFKDFDISSVVGSNGSGKECLIEGGKNISIGKDCNIGVGSELVASNNHFNQVLNPSLIIGNHVRATARCRITCKGRITIGDDVLIAPDVFITDHNHGMNPKCIGGYSSQDLIVDNVSIGKGVWLGERVMVLPGVKIGEHSIIGAGSIVTHDIPAYSIAVGSPARVIKKWNENKKAWESVNET